MSIFSKFKDLKEQIKTNNQIITEIKALINLIDTPQTVETESKTVDSSINKQVITPTDGKLLSEVIINPIETQSKTVTPTMNKQTIKPDTGKLLSEVIVNPIVVEYIKGIEFNGSSKTLTIDGSVLFNGSGSIEITNLNGGSVNLTNCTNTAIARDGNMIINE